MTDDQDDIWVDLEKLGVTEVRKRLASNVYGERRKPHVIQWLQHQESNRSAAGNEANLAEARSSNSISHEANNLARTANDFASAANTLALAANETASSALAEARRSAVYAKTSNIIATASAVAAIISIAISIKYGVK